MNSKTIVLIGPMATGKSTIAHELEKKTGIRRVPMDRVRWYYYFQNGYDLQRQDKIEDFEALLTYWKPFEVDAVERVVNEFSGSIIDFGAGHSFFKDEQQFTQVANALEKIENIILLLPSESKEESLRICNERLMARNGGRELSDDEKSSNRDFIFHSSNYQLAKKIIYTDGKTPSECADEIIQSMKGESS